MAMNGVNSVDIVQFSCPLYFVEEKEDVCSVEVMRLGGLQGEVSVRFATEDVSAKAGERYQGTSGKVTFLDGEARRVIQIAVIQKDDWCPTLEFRVRLSEPDNCYLGLYLQACNVKVIDDDIFPSDKYYDEITREKDGVRNVNSYGLFAEYVKMNFAQKGIHWKTCLTLVFDQLNNANMYLKLSISAYLVNVVFLIDESTEDQLWVQGSRAATASIVGLLYILPMLVLHLWDHIKIKLDIQGHTQVFLSSCLFRKYLNYSEESRQDVAPSEMQLGLLTECTDLASGYTAILDMVQQFGKLCLMILFVIIKEPTAIYLVLAMPTLISIFAYFRGSAIAEGRRERDRRERELIGIIAQTCEKYLTIRHYNRRSAREEMYRLKADQSRLAELPVHTVQNNNLYASKWLGPLFIGFYICLAAPLVLAGDLKLGFFLATISILDDMSGLFLDVYERFQKITEIAEPLMTLTGYYNMATDLRPFKKSCEHELNWMHAARAEVTKMPMPPPDAKMMRTDLIPILFEDVSYSFGQTRLFERVNLTIKQGMMVAISGNHGCGKATLLKLIGRMMVPGQGNIFIPPHLRILFVAQEPAIMLDLTLWENLTMGCPDGIDPGLVTSILMEMGMERTLAALDYFNPNGLGDNAGATSSPPELGGEGGSNSPREASQEGLLSGDSEAMKRKKGTQQSTKEAKREADQRDVKKRKELAQWFDKLNYSEKVKLHLARAFIMNAELMVLHRPLYHFDEDDGQKILGLVRQHHKNRGLCMPVTTLGRRRPRTVFITIDDGHEWQENSADIVWRVDEDRTIKTRRPKHPLDPETESPSYRREDFLEKKVPQDGGLSKDKSTGSWWNVNQIGDLCASPRDQSMNQGPAIITQHAPRGYPR